MYSHFQQSPTDKLARPVIFANIGLSEIYWYCRRCRTVAGNCSTECLRYVWVNLKTATLSHSLSFIICPQLTTPQTIKDLKYRFLFFFSPPSLSLSIYLCSPTIPFDHHWQASIFQSSVTVHRGKKIKFKLLHRILFHNTWREDCESN